MLLNLLIPFVLTVGSGSKGLPQFTQNIFSYFTAHAFLHVNMRQIDVLDLWPRILCLVHVASLDLACFFPSIDPPLAFLTEIFRICLFVFPSQTALIWNNRRFFYFCRRSLTSCYLHASSAPPGVRTLFWTRPRPTAPPRGTLGKTCVERDWLNPPAKHLISVLEALKGKFHFKKMFFNIIYLNLLSLALKVVLVCFERQLGNQWYKLSLQVKEMALRKVGGLAFWDFIDFIVRTRIPIFILLRPFIQCKVRF